MCISVYRGTINLLDFFSSLFSLVKLLIINACHDISEVELFIFCGEAKNPCNF